MLIKGNKVSLLCINTTSLRKFFSREHKLWKNICNVLLTHVCIYREKQHWHWHLLLVLPTTCLRISLCLFQYWCQHWRAQVMSGKHGYNMPAFLRLFQSVYVRKNYFKCQHQQSVFITGRYRYLIVCTFLKRFLHLAVIVKRRGKVDLLITFFITSQKQISFGKKICSRTLPRQIFLLFCGRGIAICILFPPRATYSHHSWMLIII